MPRRSPGARERSLGAEMRALRESITPRLTVTEAARRMGWSKTLLSNLENGRRNISSEEIASLCTIYGVTDNRRDTLIARCTADEPFLWEKALPGLPPESGALLSYEPETSRMVSWQPMLIPGLLQTMDYTRAFMLADGIPASQIEPRLMARLRRQQVLRGPVGYTALIGEVALHAAVGGPAIMAAQLREVLVAAQRPNVTVRIVPMTAVHSGLLGQWLLLEFPHASPVAHVELLRSAVFLEREEALPYVDAAARLLTVSMTETESLQVIAEMAKTMEGEAHGQPSEEVEEVK